MGERRNRGGVSSHSIQEERQSKLQTAPGQNCLYYICLSFSLLIGTKNGGIRLDEML